MSKIILTGREVVEIIAKHGSKEQPELKAFDGNKVDITLCAKKNKIWAEIEIKEK